MSALLRIGVDEAAALPDAPQRRLRRPALQALTQPVPLDRAGPGIEALVRELLAQLDRRVLDRHRRLSRRGLGPRRAGLEAFESLLPIAPPPRVERLAGDLVLPAVGRHVDLPAGDCRRESHI